MGKGRQTINDVLDSIELDVMSTNVKRGRKVVSILSISQVERTGSKVCYTLGARYFTAREWVRKSDREQREALSGLIGREN